MTQFYFAWVDATDTAFSADFEREDLAVYSFARTHAEGQFPALTVDARNPHEGLLNPGRKQWVWFSVADESTDGARPLFFGRLVGVPMDPQDDVVTLDFVARPVDYNAQRAALAETLRVAPWYDPLWLDQTRRADPDAVLDARSAAWHVDPVTHVVTISDLISGEDGTLNLAGNFFHGSLKISYGQPPAGVAHVEGRVDWSQAATGIVDLTASLLAAAEAAGSGQGGIATYTGEGLASAWPKKGDSIGADWSFDLSAVIRGNGLWVPAPSPGDATVVLKNATVASFPLWSFAPVLNVKYDSKRSRSETVIFDLVADVQALVTDPLSTDDQEFMSDVVTVKLSSSAADQPIDPPDDTDGEPTGFPIGDRSRRSYFKTARGRRSIEYLICLARQQLLARARCVTIAVETDFARGLGLTCRQNVAIADPRLPGGAAAGKVIGTVLARSGDTGASTCSITLACTIGNGNTVTADAGTPDYVADGYVEDGYQTRTAELIMPIAGEVVYASIAKVPIHDDGVDFARMTADRVIRHLTIVDGAPEQLAVINDELAGTTQSAHNDAQAVIDGLNQVFTEVDLELVPLNHGPFATTFNLSVSELMVPQTIDLEAASA